MGELQPGRKEKLRGGGEAKGPTREESGMVPAICLALLGLAWLPADGELVRGAHKQRQSSPTHPQGHCLFMCRKKGGTHSVAGKRKGDRERGEKRELERGRIRDSESEKC